MLFIIGECCILHKFYYDNDHNSHYVIIHTLHISVNIVTSDSYLTFIEITKVYVWV